MATASALTPTKAAPPAVSVPQSSTQEDPVDEVKIFRTTDDDDVEDIAAATAELDDDKKDLARQAEIESGTEPFRPTPVNMAQAAASMGFCSPSANQFLFPCFPFHPMAPISPILSPILYGSCAVMAANRNVQMFNQMAAAAAIAARSSPSYLQSPFAQLAADQLARSPFAAGLVSLGAGSSSTNFQNPLNSPMASMSSVLGGISLSSENKNINHHNQPRMQDKRQGQQQQTSFNISDTVLSSTEHQLQQQQHHHHQQQRLIIKREKREAKKDAQNSNNNKLAHIKKPMNAYMIFMKHNRERFLKEQQQSGDKRIQSADLNKLMGEHWQRMSKDEQKPYYDMSEAAREEHKKKYPEWSARENYAINKKKKKRREKSLENNDQKKCRAKYGVDNQDKWCKHCKRKKRCLNVRDDDSSIVSSTTNPTTPSSSSSSTAATHHHGGNMMVVGCSSAGGGDPGSYPPALPPPLSQHNQQQILEQKFPDDQQQQQQQPFMAAMNSAALAAAMIYHHQQQRSSSLDVVLKSEDFSM